MDFSSSNDSRNEDRKMGMKLMLLYLKKKIINRVLIIKIRGLTFIYKIRYKYNC